MTLRSLAKMGTAACALAGGSAMGAVLTFGTMVDGEINSASATTVSSFTGGAMALGFSSARADYTLGSVSLALSRNSSIALARVRVYSGTQPTTLLATRSVTLAGMPSVAQAVTFDGFNVALSAATTYWLVLDAEQGSMQIHNAPTTQAAVGAAGITLTAYRSINAVGASGLAGAPIELPNFVMTVPEPEEYALAAGLGLVAFALLRRGGS